MSEVMRDRQAEGGAGDKVQTAVRHSGRSVAIYKYEHVCYFPLVSRLLGSLHLKDLPQKSCSALK